MTLAQFRADFPLLRDREGILSDLQQLQGISWQKSVLDPRFQKLHIVALRLDQIDMFCTKTFENYEICQLSSNSKIFFYREVILLTEPDAAFTGLIFRSQTCDRLSLADVLNEHLSDQSQEIFKQLATDITQSLRHLSGHGFHHTQLLPEYIFLENGGFSIEDFNVI